MPRSASATGVPGFAMMSIASRAEPASRPVVRRLARRRRHRHPLAGQVGLALRRRRAGAPGTSPPGAADSGGVVGGGATGLYELANADETAGDPAAALDELVAHVRRERRGVEDRRGFPTWPGGVPARAAGEVRFVGRASWCCRPRRRRGGRPLQAEPITPTDDRSPIPLVVVVRRRRVLRDDLLRRLQTAGRSCRDAILDDVLIAS